MNSNLSCSNCGAPAQFTNRFDALTTCKYCGSSIKLVVPEATDGVVLNQTQSFFRIGQSYAYNESSFTVQGSLKYAYEGGSWDEFYCIFSDNTSRWLQEDEGQITLFSKQAITSPLPKPSSISVGQVIEVNQTEFFVTEKTRAVIAKAQGSLPTQINIGIACTCLDGNMNGSLYSLEIYTDQILLSKGQNIPLSEITAKPL